VGPRLAVTPGDPRGIGPEVAVLALDRFLETSPDADVRLWASDGPTDHQGFAELVRRGRSHGRDDQWAGDVAAQSIEGAVGAALAGEIDAVVTAPLHKPSLHAAGRVFPGQTEMLAHLSGAPTVGMLMAAERTRLGPPLRVLLATTHLPLRSVCDVLTADLFVDQIALLDAALRTDWGFAEPTIGVCGVNPHASDGGLFGDEEARLVEPALAILRDRGLSVEGPLPADTVFSRALDGDFDAVVAPYHDVGMAPFKTVSFGAGVNVTIGLPFVRTSPDHGTAFDIAGSGSADPSSMLEAIRLAHRLAQQRFDTPAAYV
jgi:4-hydroxythreonine-4-phosphate dehydrogenase